MISSCRKVPKYSYSERAPFAIRDIEPHSSQKNLLYLTFTLRVEASLTFPKLGNPFFGKYRDFAGVIQDIVLNYWNWDNEVDRLREIRIKQIGRTRFHQH